MATDLERLVVQLSADIKGYQSEMQKAAGITNRQARAVEARWKQSERNLNAIGGSMARGLIAPLTGVAAALTTREILSYADAWTKAKNSLAVAGVTGATQAVVLDRLYQSAQANSTPIGALADLFGKAAQASDNLGASNEDLIQFSDGVAVALRVAGTGAQEASGALTQLGQLLGSARVQAEEFNSVNEGARPILIAVANGLDAAGGSVNKLKQLVNDGKVSGQQFFQAFLKGLPSIQSMAASSAQTIDQGVTKVTNALTRYIGQTDESLGASQRLVAGLNALADNFAATADIVLKVASIIAGALVGRAIGGMIANLGLAATAVTRFVGALRTAATMGSIIAAIGGVATAAGPIGLVVGGTAVAALTLFRSTADKASVGAKVYAENLLKVEAAAKASAAAIDKTSASISQEMANRLSAGVREGEQEIERAKEAAISLFSTIIQNAPRRLVSEEQISSLEEMRDKLRAGSSTADETKNALFTLANSSPTFQRLADQMKPLLDALAKATANVKDLKEQLATTAPPSFRQAENASMEAYAKMQQAGQSFLSDLAKQNALSKDQLALEKEIAAIRKEAQTKGVTLSDQDVKQAAQDRLAAEKRRSSEGKKPKSAQADEYQRATEELRKNIAATETEISTLGQSAYAIDYAKTRQELLNAAKEAGRAITPQLTAEIEREAAAHALVAQRLEDAQKKQEKLDEAKRKSEHLSKEVQDGLADVATSGLIAMQEGNSVIDAMTSSLKSLEQQLIKMAMQKLLEQILGPLNSGGASALTSLFGGSSTSPVLTSSGFTTGFYRDGGVVHAATGGRISGPGTGTSDDVPVWASNGEFIVNARATRRNRATLEAINNGVYLPKFASGGVVGGGRSGISAPGQIRVDVINPQSTPTVTQESDGMGGRRIKMEFRDMTAEAVQSRKVRQSMRTSRRYT